MPAHAGQTQRARAGGNIGPGPDPYPDPGKPPHTGGHRRHPIVSCDETGAALDTVQGRLTIGGQAIQVGELSVRTGEVRIFGKIEFLQYTENRESAGGFFRRLFG